MNRPGDVIRCHFTRAELEYIYRGLNFMEAIRVQLEKLPGVRVDVPAVQPIFGKLPHYINADAREAEVDNG